MNDVRNNEPRQDTDGSSENQMPQHSQADIHFKRWDHKTELWIQKGIREGHARDLANLELRIEDWPSAWGDDLRVLIYGDFDEPKAEIDFPELGITIEPGRVANSVIASALCVMNARVKVSEKSITAIVDAAARISTLLGVIAAMNWGNVGMGWWSFVTHGSMTGTVANLAPDRTRTVVEVLGKFPANVAQKVRSALFWIREPRQPFRESYRSDILRVYAGYWNAFECLVEAVCLLRPQAKLGPEEKQAFIDEYITNRTAKLDAEAIAQCYRQFVDPGFVAKASHALAVCFPERANDYVVECFKMKPKQDRLYDIRNAINHGDIDADNPDELMRVANRHRRLWMIVFGMLGLLVPIDRPLDHNKPG